MLLVNIVARCCARVSAVRWASPAHRHRRIKHVLDGHHCTWTRTRSGPQVQTHAHAIAFEYQLLYYAAIVSVPSLYALGRSFALGHNYASQYSISLFHSFPHPQFIMQTRWWVRNMMSAVCVFAHNDDYDSNDIRRTNCSIRTGHRWPGPVVERALVVAAVMGRPGAVATFGRSVDIW